MSAPVVEQDAPVADVPENATAIRLPVMAVEGLETADGRYLAPGGISHRTLPITLYAQIQTPNGGAGHDNSVIAGAITEMRRIPGPEVISKATGEPFPEGTFIWEGTKAWVYNNVRFTQDGPTVLDMVRDRALSGNSIDLSDIIAEHEYEPGTEDDPNAQPVRLTMHQGVIGATTLVGLPAFPDAYVEIDGESMTPDAVTAAALVDLMPISWRSVELGDDCAACRTGNPLPREQFVAEGAAPPVHRGGMIALVPAEASALAVDGGDPEDELHLTLAYLGDDVSGWTEGQRQAVHDLGRSLAEVSDGLEARVFAHARFNPDGGPDGDKEPCAVYLIGDGDTLAAERELLIGRLRENLGEVTVPEQHSPFVPHVTAGYGVDVSALSFTGPVRFDRVRVALGGDVTDYPIGGGQAMVAAALPVLPSAAFHVPEPDGYTAPYITEPDANGYRHYAGHIARWDACHIGYQGKCVTPPRSRSKYANFHLGLARTEKGDILAGVITFNRADQARGGHADIRLSAADTVAHYDNTATVGADVVVSDGKYGPWACGVVRTDLSSEDLHRFRMSMPSGDWRRVAGSLDLVGVLHVNTPGFSGPRTLVASGEPLALVAGVQPRLVASEETLESLRQRYPLMDERAVRERLGLSYPGYEGSVGPFESDYASPHVYARDVMSGAGNCMCGSGPDDPIHPELVPGVPNPNAGPVEDAAEEEGDLYDDGNFAAALERLAELTTLTIPPVVQFAAEVDILLAVHGAELANWVEKAGGLPPYIKRIKKHLEAGGMDESRAVASAVNAAKKMCATGDTSLPGVQKVNAGSRAEACAAVAQWEAKKAKS